MSEPESKKLEEALQGHIDGKVLFDAAGESVIPMKQVCRDALAALREKDAMIEFLNDAIGGWKAGAREKDEEIARLKAEVAQLRKTWLA